MEGERYRREEEQEAGEERQRNRLSELLSCLYYSLIEMFGGKKK